MALPHLTFIGTKMTKKYSFVPISKYKLPLMAANSLLKVKIQCCQLFKIRNNFTWNQWPFFVLGVGSDDGGLYTCSAINTVGKCLWETTVDLKAKPHFTLPNSLTRPITYQIDELMSLKVPLIAVPEPSLLLEKLDSEDETKVEATFQALVRYLRFKHE